MAKKQEETSSVRTLNPEERKKFKQLVAAITHAKKRIEDEQEAIREYLKDIKGSFGIAPKMAKKIADTMFNNSYESVVSEHEHFEYLYESVVEGKLNPTDETVDDE